MSTKLAHRLHPAVMAIMASVAAAIAITGIVYLTGVPVEVANFIALSAVLCVTATGALVLHRHSVRQLESTNRLHATLREQRSQISALKYHILRSNSTMEKFGRNLLSLESDMRDTAVGVKSDLSEQIRLLQETVDALGAEHESVKTSANERLLRGFLFNLLFDETERERPISGNLGDFDSATLTGGR